MIMDEKEKEIKFNVIMAACGVALNAIDALRAEYVDFECLPLLEGTHLTEIEGKYKIKFPNQFIAMLAVALASSRSAL